MRAIDYVHCRHSFELKARQKGYNDFGRRGEFYNVSALNMMWEGYLMAVETL